MPGSRKLVHIGIFLGIILVLTAAWKYYSPAYVPASVDYVTIQPPADAGPEQPVEQEIKTYSMQEKPVKGIPVLMYHKVSPDPRIGSLTYRVMPEDFDWQMRYLKENGYHTVNLGQVVDYYQNGGRLPEKPIVITIDDGYQDNYAYAFPILKKYGLTATIFIVTNTVGGTNVFDTAARLQPESRMLSWDEIREMDAAGITMGAHTLDHVHLSKVNLEESRRQVIESKKRLEKELNHEVKYFCYPYGEYNRAVLDIVKKSGFTAATSVEPGLTTSRQDPFLYNRIAIQGSYDHSKFIQEVNKH